MTYARNAEQQWQALVEYEKYQGRGWLPLAFWIGYVASLYIFGTGTWW